MGERRFCVGHATTRRVSSVSSCGLLTFLCLRPLLLLPAAAFSLPTFPTALFIFFPTATVSWGDSFHGFSDGGRYVLPDSPSRIHREGICAPLVAEDAKRELAIREKWKAQDEEAWDEARSLEENLNSPLFRAIQAKNVRQAKSLLLDGATPDARDIGSASRSNGARPIAMGGLSGKCSSRGGRRGKLRTGYGAHPIPCLPGSGEKPEYSRAALSSFCAVLR